MNTNLSCAKQNCVRRRLGKPAVTVVVKILVLVLARPALAQPEPSSAQDFLLKLQRKLAHAETRAAGADDVEAIASALRSLSYALGQHLVRDPDPVVRQKMARAIGTIGATATDAIPYLIKALDDPNEEVRIAAVKAVGGTAPASKAALGKIIAFARDKDPRMRRAAISVMRGFGPQVKDLLPVLIEALSDPDPGEPGKAPSVSYCAATVLAAFGPDAKAASEALLKLQKCENLELRGAALQALTRILPKDASLIPIYLDVLRNKDLAQLRRGAALALGTLGAAAKDAVPVVIEILKSNDVRDRNLDDATKGACIWALGEIGPEAHAAISVLSELTTHLNPAIRKEVKLALEKIQKAK